MFLEKLSRIFSVFSFNRIYIVYSNTAVTAPVFTPESMATAGGRMDVVARSILYALYDQIEQRGDTLFIGLLNGSPRPPVALYAWRLSLQNRSELEVGEAIRRALSGERLDGIEVENGARITDILETVRKTHRVYLLDESGMHFSHFTFTGKNAFILGDHIGIPAWIISSIENMLDGAVSLGKKPYLTSHCIAFLNELMDRA
ncbi:MAG: hypothetical protein QXX32_03920 [Thermofilum sp.]|uniref:Uncharacterized protein n=2 Tax=Thermofilum adornatum TaxID=1365176 RepID=S5Z786_9CREN|nr:hypothetical protein [Thermofilum adornatum]AGT35200.1 hypothetical protein N186_04240 [Thermofilum adornatum]